MADKKKPKVIPFKSSGPKRKPLFPHKEVGAAANRQFKEGVNSKEKFNLFKRYGWSADSLGVSEKEFVKKNIEHRKKFMKTQTVQSPRPTDDIRASGRLRGILARHTGV